MFWPSEHILRIYLSFLNAVDSILTFQYIVYEDINSHKKNPNSLYAISAQYYSHRLQ